MSKFYKNLLRYLDYLGKNVYPAFMLRALLPIFALFIFPPVTVQSYGHENVCGHYTEHTASGGFADYQSHDYTNGLLNIHLKFNVQASTHTIGLVNKLLRITDCQEASAYGQWYGMSTAEIPMDVNNFSFRFTGQTGPGTYTYQIYDDDINQPLSCSGCDTQFFDMIYFGYEAPHKIRLVSYLIGPEEPPVTDRYYLTDLSSSHFITSALDIRQPADWQPARTPVLIVPGVLGTELFDNLGKQAWFDGLGMFEDNNDEFLIEILSLNQDGQSNNSVQLGNVIDKKEFFVNISGNPIVLYAKDIFFSLVGQLEQIEYQQDQSIFYFPYDWRLDLDTIKDQLNLKIEAIKLQTGAQKVDVIAHSMGGLLTKAYLEAYGNSSVNKLIFVGTPHLGAPKAGKVLLEGDRFDVPMLEADRMRDLALNSPSIHQLLPNPTYFNQFQGYIKPYSFFGNPAFYNYQQTQDYFVNDKGKNPVMFQKAQNFFDKNLQDLDLSGIDAYNLVGCKKSTQSAYKLSAFGGIGRVGFSSGDETVPMVSSQYSPGAKNYYVKNANHSELPSTDGVRELILDILNNTAPALAGNVSESSSFCNFKGKTLFWKSPVEVHIYSGGLHTGPIENNGIEYGIPGVNYDVIDGKKFIYLPTDEGQTYEIQGFGESQGTFDLLVSENDNGNDLNTFVYNDLPIAEGTPISFDVSETSINSEIQVDNLTVLADSQLLSGQTEDLTPPETTATASGTVGNNGWYKSNVLVDLTATDDLSGVLETKYRLNSSTPFEIYSVPINLTNEGINTLEFYSIDNAGNNEEINTLEIKIDKIAAEFTARFSPQINDFEFLGSENLVPVCGVDICTATDIAGNTSVIKFQKNKILNSKTLSLKQIEQNGINFVLPENLLIVSNLTSLSNLRDFNQAVLIKKQKFANIYYVKKKNISNISELTASTWKRYTLPGIHQLEINTNKNNLSFNIQ